MNSCLPDRVRLAHRDPHVRVDYVRALHRVHWLRVEFQNRAGLRGDFLARFDQRLVREIRLRRARDKVHAHLRAADHEGVSHVVPRVTHIHELFALQTAKMLLNRQEIGQNLRGMEFVRQSIPDGNARVFCQILYNFLPVAAIFDAVVHAAEDARSVGDGLLFADLRAGRVEIRDRHAQIMRRNLERAARPRAGLFKNKRGLLALAQAVGDAGLFLCLELGGKRQKVRDLLRRKIKQL